MFKCDKCGDEYHSIHYCLGYVAVKSAEPVFSDNWSATLWNVRELRKEVEALRAELHNRGPVKAFAHHWAEHDQSSS